ncbi:MAG: CapA family protein [Polyangiaceae bacterium]
MREGSVYLWTPSSANSCGGSLTYAVVALPRLDDEGPLKLSGRWVSVHNAGSAIETDLETGHRRTFALGDARPDEAGNFVYDPGRGGGRMDKQAAPRGRFMRRYIAASRFGEVNAYYHLDRASAYLNQLLAELDAPALPRIVVRVNAHDALSHVDGECDGECGTNRWMPFQGGHYRLSQRPYGPRELREVTPSGEIHLGAGWRTLEHGALVALAGSHYRANAAHNAGILYHEFGHHLTRHTADLQGNAQRRPERQSNVKCALDEAIADYFTAALLETPHIWALHQRHDDVVMHARSLSIRRHAREFVEGRSADPHSNGSIVASALWRVRESFGAAARDFDRLVVAALCGLGAEWRQREAHSLRELLRSQASFQLALSALLGADERLYASRHRAQIAAVFAEHGVAHVARPQLESTRSERIRCVSMISDSPVVADSSFSKLLKRVPADEIPPTSDLLSAQALDASLAMAAEPPFDLMVVGDIMLGGRSSSLISRHGADYCFQAVRPLLDRTAVCLGNLEGPMARDSRKEDRNFSYRVQPALASALLRNRVNVVTLANNHLVDCGRSGVVETLEALEAAGVRAIGAGLNETEAHRGVVMQAGALRLGLLGYYWNRRTAATDELPGSAMDPPEALARDISRLRAESDRVVVTFHWGVPYEAEPSPEDCAKARLAIELGADAVVSHHPHVVQKLEVHHGRPIFYSVGNFTFGSGNSRAEGLMVGLRFDDQRTRVGVYPIYVKNRDPRVDYQPKVLGGASAERALGRLAQLSGEHAQHLRIENGRGVLSLPRSALRGSE